MEKFSIPGVGGIIEKQIDGCDYILVQKRQKDDNKEYGMIEIPAGKIREYENIFSCLRREIKEETGLDVTKIFGEEDTTIVENGDYKVISYEPFACSQNIIGDYPIMVQTFICSAEGTMLEESNESQEMQWIELAKLSNKLDINEDIFYPMHVNTLRKYLSYKGY